METTKAILIFAVLKLWEGLSNNWPLNVSISALDGEQQETPKTKAAYYRSIELSPVSK